jgi:hypothetical protein
VGATNMTSDDLDPALQMDVLAQMLKSSQQETGALVELLASLMESSLPDRTKVTRGGWFMSKTRPVEELTIQFEDAGYQITKNKHGAVSVRQQKMVRGVALKSTDISMEQCINDLMTELSQLAEKHAETRAALNKFVMGR